MIFQHAKMAIKSLRSNKVRTFLTLLGIIIGVTSVTVVIGLGEGVKRQVNQQINNLGSDLITVVPGRNVNNSSFSTEALNHAFSSSTTASYLGEKDLAALSKLPNVASATGIMRLDSTVSSEHKKINTRVMAVSEDYLSITKQKLASGQFFGKDISNNNTAVLSAKVASNLFGNEDPIGNTLRLRGSNFIVIGVLDKQTGFNLGRPINDMLLIPLATGKTLNHDSMQLQQITLKVKNSSANETTAKAAKSVIKKNHAGEEDFTITTQQQLVGATDDIFRVLTGFTAAVASISLLVGGIGVMNIMLVTVTERTREIGIRKAVGATKTQIMMQFLTESLAITLSGGIIGIIISIIIGYIIKAQTSVEPAMDLWILLLAAGVSLIVGIIFGTWPAIRAATKNPTEALKYE